MQSLDLDVLERARDWRKAGHRVWLLTVAQTFGASPRPPGSLGRFSRRAAALGRHEVADPADPQDTRSPQVNVRLASVSA